MSHINKILESYGMRAQYIPIVDEIIEPDSVLDRISIVEKSLGITAPASVQTLILEDSGDDRDENRVVIGEPA